MIAEMIVPYSVTVTYWNNVKPLKDQITFCCEKMRKLWNNTEMLSLQGEINNSEKAKVFLKEIDYIYGESSIDYHPIKFCPFCGAPIKTEEKQRKIFKKIIKPKTIDDIEWIEVNDN